MINYFKPYESLYQIKTKQIKSHEKSRKDKELFSQLSLLNQTQRHESSKVLPGESERDSPRSPLLSKSARKFYARQG